MKVLDAVVLHLRKLRDLSLLLHLVEDSESEERSETLTIWRALRSDENQQMSKEREPRKGKRLHTSWTVTSFL